MTNENCEVCDREGCDAAKLADPKHCDPYCRDWNQFGGEGEGRGYRPCPACLDCREHAVDWRERALTAEGKILLIDTPSGQSVWFDAYRKVVK